VRVCLIEHRARDITVGSHNRDRVCRRRTDDIANHPDQPPDRHYVTRRLTPIRTYKTEPPTLDAYHPGTTPTTKCLLEKVLQGDPEALASLYDLYSQLVYSIALRILRDSHCAEDVVQEIFMQIWRLPERFLIAEGDFAGWMAVVARNRSIDILRGYRPSDPIEDHAIASSYNLSIRVEEKLMYETAQVLIGNLSLHQQTVLEMAFFEGMSHSEIAQKLGCPLGTIKTRIRSALLVLRNGLGARGSQITNGRGRQRTEYMSKSFHRV
jgi:RNA polymerase sigma-70 factor, ECF subfamily